MKNNKNCEVNNALSIISGKWKPALIFTLITQGPMRFNELEKALNGVTPKMLTSQLKSLEKEGLIKRIQFDEMPPKVVYEMTPYGMELKKVLTILHDWGNRHHKQHQSPKTI